MERIKSQLIDRYLYDVVRRLPEKQRKDIEEELRTLVEDMLEERAENGKTQEQNIKEVLGELGAPSGLAARYRGSGEHLIGGEYYPLYCQILKIVLICVGAGMAVSAVAGAFVGADVKNLDGIVGYIVNNFMGLASIPSAMIQAFGILTIIFFLLERSQVNVKEAVGQVWNVDRLPQIPSRKAAISRGDCIVGIIFGILAAVLFTCAPQLIGVTLSGEDGRLFSVPFFDLSVWRQALPFLLAAVLAGALADLVKLAYGHYGAAVMWVTIAADCLSVVLTAVVFKGHDIWNRNFTEEISAVTGKIFNSQSDMLAGLHSGRFKWETVGTIVVAVVTAACLIEIAVTVYRTVRYGLREGK